MTRKISIPSVSGSQPPSAIFSRLAQKKLASTSRNAPPASNETGSGHCHTRRMAANSRQLVNSMVVETAVPYAPASRSELRKAIVIDTVPIIISQLTTGT